MGTAQSDGRRISVSVVLGTGTIGPWGMGEFVQRGRSLVLAMALVRESWKVVIDGAVGNDVLGWDGCSSHFVSKFGDFLEKTHRT